MPGTIITLTGTHPGSSVQTGCTTVTHTASTSGTSILSGAKPYPGRAFRLISASVRFDAPISSGVTIWFNAKDGSDYDVAIATTVAAAERNITYVPTTELWVPGGNDIDIITGPTNVSGTTRWYTIVVEA